MKKLLSLFGSFQPVDTLYWFDGPLIFTVELSDGRLCLAYLADGPDELEFLRYLVAVTDQDSIDALKAKELPVRDVLECDTVWVVDVAFDGTVFNASEVDVDDLPREMLPEEDALLYA